MPPAPKLFREAAVAAATGEYVSHIATPELREWCAKALGHKEGFFWGYPNYEAPNHARVITFLWLELMARECR